MPVMNETASAPGYKFFRQLNTLEDRSWVGSKTTFTLVTARRFFAANRLQDKLARALGTEGVLPVKEVLECCEFFERIREHTRAAVVADLCCGHGLLGLLFALFERGTREVILSDGRIPDSQARVIECICRLAPWVREKVRVHRMGIDQVDKVLPEDVSVVSAHACGLLTDACIDLAIRKHGAIGVLPCCHPERLCPGPPAVRHALGVRLAFDIERTYRLEHAGYRVRWSEIPSEITPMNRVLVAGRAQSANIIPCRPSGR